MIANLVRGRTLGHQHGLRNPLRSFHRHRHPRHHLRRRDMARNEALKMNRGREIEQHRPYRSGKFVGG